MFASAYSQISGAERRFVDRLVESLAEAARIANISIRTALHEPLPPKVTQLDYHGWLERPLVRAAIAEQVNGLADGKEFTPEVWLNELANIATFDQLQYFTTDIDGDPTYDIEQMRADGKSGAIKSIEIERSDMSRINGKLKIKITAHDKMQALKMLQGYLGLDNDDNPQRRLHKAAQDVPRLTSGMSASEAGEAYARFIGDGE